jgi:peptide/nickel transport system substrate-binding protein
MNRRTCLRLVGLTSAATLLGGCSSPVPAPRASVSPTAGTASGSTLPPATNAPARVGLEPVFRIDELSDVPSLNPLVGNAAAARRRVVQLFSSLYQYDTSNNLVPDLATAMPRMPDAQTYIVPLRSNVRFHSGKQMTADDVKFTYDTLLKPDYGAIWRSAVAPVLESITVHDPATVVFKLNKPFGPFLTKLALIPIVNLEQSKDELSQRPDGTGPFTFVAYQQGSVLRMARNDAYYAPDLKPRIGALSIHVVPENSTRYANVANGITQLVPEPAFSDIDLLKSRGLVINSVRAPASTYGYINFKRPDGPMIDKHLRRALAFALDRSAIVQNIWAGQGIPGQVFMRPELWPFDPNYRPFSDTPDLARAKAELAQSPHAGDRVVLTTANDDALGGTAVLIQSAARAAGLNVDVSQLDRAAFAAELIRDGWDILLTDSYTGANSGLEADAINSLFVTDASANFGKYANAEMDREVRAAIFAVSHDAALPHYKRVMEIDAEDIPVLTVAYHNYVEALSGKVQNYRTSPLALYDLRMVTLA